MHRGHQPALDAEVVVQHLGDWGQAVGGAGSGGNDGLASVGVVVHAVHEHRRVILAWRALYDFFGAGLDVRLARFFGQEETGAVDHDIRARFVPLQVGGVTLSRQANFLAVNHHIAAVNRDVAIEAAVYGVVLQHVSQVFGVEQVVDGDDLDVFEVFRDSAEHHSSDAAETVDADFNCHGYCSLKIRKIKSLTAKDAKEGSQRRPKKSDFLCVTLRPLR